MFMTCRCVTNYSTNVYKLRSYDTLLYVSAIRGDDALTFTLWLKHLHTYLPKCSKQQLDQICLVTVCNKVCNSLAKTQTQRAFVSFHYIHFWLQACLKWVLYVRLLNNL